MKANWIYWSLFAILAVATIQPIWIVHYLPLLDIPNHLAAITVWHYYDDPAWNFQPYYTLNLAPLPYWAHYYTVHLLTYVTRSVELANKIFLTGYALTLPLGARALARRFGRSEWLALMSFPLVWNFNFCDGFLAYCTGLAVLPLLLVLVDRHYARPRWQTALAVLVCGSSVYFFHLLVYMLFLVLASMLIVVQERPFNLRLLAVRWLPVFACTGVGLWAFKHGNSMGFHHLTGDGYEGVNEPISYNLMIVWERIFNFLPGDLDDWLTVAIIVSILALLVTGMRQPRDRDATSGGRAHDFGIEVLFATLLVLFLVAPRSMRKPFYWHMLNGRFITLAALFAMLLVRGRIDGWRRWLLAPALVVSLLYTVQLSRAFIGFNRRLGGFERLVPQIPRDKTVLTLMLKPMNDPEVMGSVYNQIPSYVQLLHGGLNRYNFDEGFPLQFKAKPPGPGWGHTENFRWDAHSRGWDYFLVFHEGWEVSVMDKPLAEGNVKLVGEAGAWRLYQKVVRERPSGSDEP